MKFTKLKNWYKEYQFKQLVRKEAKNLRRTATHNELAKLDFEDLNVTSITKCIYGQMTGHCENNRAVELIEKCAKRVFRNESGVSYSNNLNGSPVGEKRESYWSPIERYIALNGNSHVNNKHLINYLNGTTKKLIIE